MSKFVSLHTDLHSVENIIISSMPTVLHYTSFQQNIQGIAIEEWSRTQKAMMKRCEDKIPYTYKFLRYENVKDITNPVFSQLYFQGSPALRIFKNL